MYFCMMKVAVPFVILGEYRLILTTDNYIRETPINFFAESAQFHKQDRKRIK